MTTAQERLNQILPSWYSLLSQWSLDGSLVAAANYALVLDGSNAKQDAKGQLQSLLSQWSAGNFKNLPQIVLLSAEDISGALGAYADSTDTVYLNQDWLLGASAEDIQKVLTHELGHYLDDQLNKVDTQGDEGELLSLFLIPQVFDSTDYSIARKKDDQVTIYINGQPLIAEATSVVVSSGWISQIRASAEPAADDTTNVATFIDGSSIVVGSFAGNSSFGSSTLASSVEQYIAAKYTSNGVLAWVAKGSGSDILCTAVSTLTDGSSIVTGSFTETVTFGSIRLVSSGGSDIFIAKIRSDGTFAWALRAGGSSNDSANSVAAYSDGSVIIGGGFTGQAKFGKTTLSTPSGTVDEAPDLFVAKITSSGSFSWATRGGGNAADYVVDTAATSDGSAYITGRAVGGTFGTFQYGPDARTAYVAKLNPSGTYSWITRIDGVYVYTKSLVALPDGRSIVVGSWQGASSDLGSTTGGANAIDTNGFVAIIDNGTGRILKRFVIDGDGTGTYCTVNSIAALSDGSGSFLVTGSFYGANRFSSGISVNSFEGKKITDIFIAKFNPNTGFQWVVKAGGPGVDEGIAVSSLSDGSAIVTGRFSGTAYFGDVPLSTGYATDSDSFVAKLNADGSWGQVVAGGNIYVGGSVNSDNITGSSMNEIFTLTGSSSSQVNLGRGQKDVVTGVGGNDIFVAGSADGVFYNDTISTQNGLADVLWIKDFSYGDLVQLKGSSASYVLKTAYSLDNTIGTGIFLNDGTGGGSSKTAWDSKDELIVFIEGISSPVSLSNSSQFLFV